MKIRVVKRTRWRGWEIEHQLVGPRRVPIKVWRWPAPKRNRK